MAFSKKEILEEFVDASRLGKAWARDGEVALADKRERVREASRLRAALWRANPANREKKRRRMIAYNATPATKRRSAERNRSPEAKAYQRARWQKPETKRARNDRRRKKRKAP